jgi:hypothetical protein
LFMAGGPCVQAAAHPLLRIPRCANAFGGRRRQQCAFVYPYFLLFFYWPWARVHHRRPRPCRLGLPAQHPASCTPPHPFPGPPGPVHHSHVERGFRRIHWILAVQCLLPCRLPVRIRLVPWQCDGVVHGRASSQREEHLFARVCPARRPGHTNPVLLCVMVCVHVDAAAAPSPSPTFFPPPVCFPSGSVTVHVPFTCCTCMALVFSWGCVGLPRCPSRETTGTAFYDMTSTTMLVGSLSPVGSPTPSPAADPCTVTYSRCGALGGGVGGGRGRDSVRA